MPSSSLVEIPLSSLSQEETETLESASLSSEAADTAEMTFSASAEAVSEGEEAGEVVAEALVDAGVATDAASGWSVIGGIIGTSMAVIGGLAVLVYAILKNEHCSIPILNMTDYDLNFEPDNDQYLYMEHGKQTAAPVGYNIPAGTDGDSELGMYVFSSKQDAFYGTMGAIMFELNVSGNPLYVQIAWCVPWSGENWCNVSISDQAQTLPLHSFYVTSKHNQNASSSFGGYTVQGAIGSGSDGRRVGTLTVVVKASA